MSKYYFEFTAGIPDTIVKGIMNASSTSVADELVSKRQAKWADSHDSYGLGKDTIFVEYYDPDLHDYYLYETDELYGSSS